MLTREHAISEYKNGRIFPDRLTRQSHAHYAGYAEQMLEIYREGKGKMRKELHRRVHAIFKDEPACPPRRIDSFCKLLDDASVYDHDKGKKSAALRIHIFRLAAPFHPLVRSVDRLFDHGEDTVKAKIAAELKKDWPQIEEAMFADVMECHRLKEFKGYGSGEELLSRYNVAQAQATLFRAVKMVVWVGSDFKTILRYAKLARLIHTIQPLEPGRYRFIFEGPASILRNTRRYGIFMAKFLPALLACGDWKMEARIQTRRKGFTAAFQLSSADKLKSHLPGPEEFDSSYEETFAGKWGDEPREGWRLVREGGILQKGQKVFIPDFVLEHEDGRRVYLEIVGFWTPEYLQAKFESLQVFKEHHILVAAAEAVAEKIPGLPANAILFKTSLNIKDVLSHLQF